MQVAELEAPALANEAPVENGLRLLVRSWKDRDRDFVKLLASRTAAAGSRSALVFCAEEGDSVRIFLARSSDLDFNCGQVLREALAALGLRGGGSADLAQGELPAKQRAALVDSLTSAIRTAAAPSQ